MYQGSRKMIAVINVVLAMTFLALVVFWPGWRTELQAEDYPWEEWSDLENEEEIEAEFFADCHTRETEYAEKEQCRDAERELEEECASRCTPENGWTSYYVDYGNAETVPDCRHYLAVSIVSCTISGAQCNCNLD